MRSMTNRGGDTALNFVTAAMGTVLFLSPWLFGFQSDFFAAWSAWIFGALIALLGLLAINQTFEWEEWINMILGSWAAGAPWMLGFSHIEMAMWVHVVSGSIVAVMAATELWRVYHAREIPSL